MARGARPIARTRSAHAAIAPGLEETLGEEVRDLGVRCQVVPGGVTFSGDPESVYAVNLYSRLAGRVTVEVAQMPARSLDQLAQEIRKLDWKPFVWPGQPVEVKATSKNSRLRNRGTLQKKVEHAIADALRGPRLPGPRPPRDPARIGVHVERDRAIVTVDASGELLHRRGWRQATAKAPIRENLAAAVLRLSGWAPGEPLVDPMCGAGTFPIEAADISMGRAPGRSRDFAFQRWPGFDKSAWDRLVAESRGQPALDRDAPILAADRDPGAVKATLDNARRAEVKGRIEVVEREFRELEPPTPTGLLVANLPYGERVKGSPNRIYKDVGRALRERWGGWRVALLVPGPRFVGAFGFRLEGLTEFSNGGIRVTVASGVVPE